MRLPLYILLTFLLGGKLLAQETDADLLTIKDRLDSIVSYKATIRLEEDISFIDMPPKEAEISFEKGKRLEVTSKDFVLLPRRGLDLSLNGLFKYPFITVNREPTELSGRLYKTVNIIPTDDSADFSIALLYLDVEKRRVVGFDLTTKEEGMFRAKLDYDSPKDLLPSKAVISFRVAKLKIPVNFMGKDTEIDRKKLREEGAGEGRVILSLSNYSIRLKGR